MADATTAFGIGLTGTGISILTIIGWFVARGIRSRCMLGDNVLSVDMHKVTQSERDAIEEERSGRKTPAPAPAPAQTAIDIVNTPGQPQPQVQFDSVAHVAPPPIHPVHTPKPRQSIMKTPKDPLKQARRSSTKSHTSAAGVSHSPLPHTVLQADVVVEVNEQDGSRSLTS